MSRRVPIECFLPYQVMKIQMKNTLKLIFAAALLTTTLGCPPSAPAPDVDVDVDTGTATSPTDNMTGTTEMPSDNMTAVTETP